MNLKKTIAIILCAASLVAVLSACGDGTPDDTTPPWDQENMDQEGHTHGFDYDTAFLAFHPDTVMISVDGLTVNWGELFFFLRGNVTALTAAYGDIYDWHAHFEDGLSYAEAIMEATTDNALFYKAVELGARQYGVTISNEEMAGIRAEFDSTAEMLGGMDMFLSLLWMEEGYYSRELFERIVSTQTLANSVFFAIYGEDSENVSDEDTAEMIEGVEFLMAKHILRLRTGDDSALREAEDILSRLDNYGGTYFDSFFDQLMNRHTEDPGVESFPDGYLFQLGDMVAPFYEACLDLNIGEYSGIVETEHGYHIIYRIPINYDVPPIGGVNAEDYRTLRNYAAGMLYETQLFEWKEGLRPIYSDEFRSIDLAEIFAR